MLSWEKEGEKQKRIQQESQPPTANANVFEWLEDDCGVFQRMAVAKAEHTDVLSNYGQNQKRYNLFFNKWDCIAELGVMNEDELARMCWDDEYILHEVQSSFLQLPPSNILAGQTEIYVPPPCKENKSLSHQLVTEDKLLESSGSSFASKFLRSLESNVQKPSAEFWDLGMGNHLSLGSSSRLKYLRQFGPLFVFNFGISTTCS